MQQMQRLHVYKLVSRLCLHVYKLVSRLRFNKNDKTLLLVYFLGW